MEAMSNNKSSDELELPVFVLTLNLDRNNATGKPKEIQSKCNIGQ